MAEHIIADPTKIKRLIELNLPLRADGRPEEREVAVGWTAADERAEITSFIPASEAHLRGLRRLVGEVAQDPPSSPS